MKRFFSFCFFSLLVVHAFPNEFIGSWKLETAKKNGSNIEKIEAYITFYEKDYVATFIYENGHGWISSSYVINNKIITHWLPKKLSLGDDTMAVYSSFINGQRTQFIAIMNCDETTFNEYGNTAICYNSPEIEIINGKLQITSSDKKVILTYNKIETPESLKADFSFTEESEYKYSLTPNISSGKVLRYSWHFSDGERSFDRNPTHQFTGTGYFTANLYLFSATSFIGTNTVTLGSKITSIIEDNLNSIETMLFPNPVKDKLFIKGIDVNDINLFTITGKKIHFSRNNSFIDFSSLDCGIYIVELTLKDKSKVIKKILKE